MEFARLVEALVAEASTGINRVRGNPGGEELLRQLHKTVPLAHDVDWKPITKIVWSHIKSKWKHGGGFILLLGRDGTGVVYADPYAGNGVYRLWASNGSPPQERVAPGVYADGDGKVNHVSDARYDSGGQSIELIRKVIGPVRSMLLGQLAHVEPLAKREKRKQDRDASPIMAPRTVKSYNDAKQAADRLLDRLRPIWDKAVVQAIADMKGYLTHQIKNDAYHKVEGRLRRLQQMDSLLRTMRADPSSTDGADSLRRILYNAIDLAVSYHFPQTPNDWQISRDYHHYRDQMPDGYRDLLNGIYSGNTRYISTVLYFFKKGLLHA